MKKIKTMMILLLLASNIYAQSLPLSTPTLSEGWQRLKIKNLGSFDIPPTMEIQNGKYKEFNDKLKSILNIEEPTIVIQQKGLNDFNQTSFKKYARVILETEFGYDNDFERLNFDINQISNEEIKELTNYLKESYQSDLSTINQRLILFYPVKIEKINNMSCIHISYIRQLNDQPHVRVHVYMFQNYDRVHKLTISYRLNEADYWKSDLEKVLKSFRITNIN